MVRNNHWDLNPDAARYLVNKHGFGARFKGMGIAVFDKYGNTGYGSDTVGAVTALVEGLELARGYRKALLRVL